MPSEMRLDHVVVGSVRSIKSLVDRLLTCRLHQLASNCHVQRMADDGELAADAGLQQQQEQGSDSERDERQLSDATSSSSSPTMMETADRGAPDADGDGSAAAEARDERPGRVFDIVLPSPTGGVAPSNGAGASALTSPATPSTSGGWSMSSSTDGSGTLCHGDERMMLSELGRRFYNRRALSDVKLRVGDRIYRCHKLLLALSSDVLERMLCCADWTDAVKQASVSHTFKRVKDVHSPSWELVLDLRTVASHVRLHPPLYQPGRPILHLTTLEG